MSKKGNKKSDKNETQTQLEIIILITALLKLIDTIINLVR